MEDIYSVKYLVAMKYKPLVISPLLNRTDHIEYKKDYEIIEAESVEDAVEQVLYPEGREEIGLLDVPPYMIELRVLPTTDLHVVDLESLRDAREKELDL